MSNRRNIKQEVRSLKVTESSRQAANDNLRSDGSDSIHAVNLYDYEVIGSSNITRILPDGGVSGRLSGLNGLLNREISELAKLFASRQSRTI